MDPDRMVRVGDLVTAKQIAERAKVVPSAVNNWRKRDPMFPEPVFEAPMTVLWLWPDVESWLWLSQRPRRSER